MKSLFLSQTCHVAFAIYVHRNQSPPNWFIGLLVYFEMMPLLRHSWHVALAIYVHTVGTKVQSPPKPVYWFIGLFRNDATFTSLVALAVSYLAVWGLAPPRVMAGGLPRLLRGGAPSRVQSSGKPMGHSPNRGSTSHGRGTWASR